MQWPSSCWKMEHYKKFTHQACEYFPCHQGVREEHFNCLFCYCPLYLLGRACGGNFVFHDGLKDCSFCTRPHDENAYDFIMEHMAVIFNTPQE